METGLWQHYKQPPSSASPADAPATESVTTSSQGTRSPATSDGSAAQRTESSFLFVDGEHETRRSRFLKHSHAMKEHKRKRRESQVGAQKPQQAWVESQTKKTTPPRSPETQLWVEPEPGLTSSISDTTEKAVLTGVVQDANTDHSTQNLHDRPTQMESRSQIQAVISEKHIVRDSVAKSSKASRSGTYGASPEKGVIQLCRSMLRAETGCRDPFASFPTEHVGAFEYKALHYYVSYMARLSFNFRVATRNTPFRAFLIDSLSDASAFHMILSAAAHHMSFVQRTEVPKRALWHRAQGLRLINEKLATQATATDPGNILAILTMAMLEYRFNSPAAATIHLSGLHAMIASIGGFCALNARSALQVAWAEMTVFSRLRETVESELNVLGSELLKSITNILALSTSRDHGPLCRTPRGTPPLGSRTTSIWGLSHTHLHRFMAGVSSNIQSYFVDAAYIGSMCQLAVLFYIHFTLHDLQNRPAQVMAYLSNLQEYVRTAIDKDERPDCMGVVLWAVMTGGNEDPHEVDDLILTYRVLRICRAIRTLGLGTRAMVTNVLMQCLLGDPSLAVDEWDPQVVRREICGTRDGE